MNILIGGAAGQGMDTIAHLLGRALTREGYGLLMAKDYMSRVRGGHNFTRMRIGTHTPSSVQRQTDILIALNEETFQIHRPDLANNSRVIYDPGHFDSPGTGPGAVPVPLEELARSAGSKIMANTVAVGAALALLGLQTATVETLLRETFTGQIAEDNIQALQAGFREAARYCNGCFSMPPVDTSAEKLFLDGNQVLGMSSLASGCSFLSAYPMTPATGIMSYLAGKQKHHNIVVEQAEDEIAAINMALGASYAGARAMTCTSGGGFALMVEGLSLAGMMETPLVVAMAMRPGPATGLPTRTEQGDLEFVLHAGHGEFPRAILCATHIGDAFYRLNKAFDLAEKYQIPVLFLSDQNYADTALSVPRFDFGRLTYNRHLADEESLERPYRRYRFSHSGISPRALPGQFAGETVLADSDEHDEAGHIIEDAETRRLMMDKRLRKIAALAMEMDEPEIYGPESGDILLIGWGSTHGVLRETCQLLNQQGRSATHLHFADLWPLPVNTVTRLFPAFRKTFCVENNATGQFAALLRRETGLSVDGEILKYDGRPFMTAEILEEVEKHV
jgi:2-oxoglutarate/2-oxoacid ferredoxin oxidoreductase subunit alpha